MLYRRRWLRIWVGLVIMLAGQAALLDGVAAQGWQPRPLTAGLTGSGGSFPAPPVRGWVNAYSEVLPTVTINYRPVGTAQGKQDFISYAVDFSGSDAALSAGLIANAAPDALNIPIVMSAAAMYYNLPGVSGLRFSPETLAGIYLGEIVKWNDGRIAADNPGVELPASTVVPIRRSDDNGTTALFTDYLSKVSNAWSSRVGVGTTVNWPAGFGEGRVGNGGVRNRVDELKGAIGYLDLAYVLANNLSVAPVKNSQGAYVIPTAASVTRAAEAAPIGTNLAASITNPPGSESYPIAGLIYVLIHRETYNDLTKAQALTDFLYWCLTQGNGVVEAQKYIPLSSNLRQKAIEALRSVTVGGQQVFDGPVQ